MNISNTLLSCEQLLQIFDESNCFESEKLNLYYPFKKDVYNITAPFVVGNKTYLAGRLEERNSEFAEIIFFERKGDNNWEYVDNATKLELQDPFVTFINKNLILGGVRIREGEDGKLIYKTEFYMGNSIFDLKYLFEGPEYMKDIRFLQLQTRKILVLTRPQGKVGGRGTIGYLILDSIEDFTINKILNAKLLTEQFMPEEWGGANEIHLIDESNVGVISHIAKFDKNGNRHYYSSSFKFNYLNGEYSPMKIIATKQQFNSKESKRPDLEDVIFSGGLIRNNDGTAYLYCGVSDCEAHRIKITDPFSN